MPEYARVDGSTVLEFRTMDPPPPHKAHLWRDVVREGDGPVENRIVESNVVRIVRSARPVVAEDVAVERARRLAAGFDYDFGDARGVHRIGTTESDLKGWSEVSTYAGALIDSGDVETLISVATDTGPTQVTAPEWRAIEIASAAFRQPLWAASFALMAHSPIPQDYTDDRHWS